MSLNRISHDDDNHVGSAKRDTVNGVAGLDASKEIINSVPIAKLVDMGEQSFTNLLINGDFESWSAGAAVAPDGWTLLGGGSSISRSATHKINNYGVALTRSGAICYLYTTLSNYLDFAEKTVVMGAWVKDSNGTNSRISIYDGIEYGVSDYHSGSSNWEYLIATKVIDSVPTALQLSLFNRNIDSTVYFDGAILVEGSVCPAFSPKPLDDDGIMLSAHTPSAANDKGVLGQWCYDATHIYVCTATDTWLRAAIATW